MRSRREQLQAHKFLTRRIVAAVLAGEPESPEQPMRRFAMSAFGGFMVSAIVLAVVGIWALLHPVGASSWEKHAIIIEKESGTRYWNNGGTLYPVLNYSSARLLMNSPAGKPHTTTRKSLEGKRRGKAVGIPGAPDTLPDAANLLGLPWRACTYRADAAVAEKMAGALVIGEKLPGGVDPGDDGLLVTDAKRTFLLWHGHRLEVPAGTGVETALGFSEDPISVSTAFLEAIPVGPPLAPALRNIGERAAKSVKGAPSRVGQLYSVEGAAGDTQYYVMLPDGLSRTFLTYFAVLTNAPALTAVFGVQQPTPITATDRDQAKSEHAKADPVNMPAEVPKLLGRPGEDMTLCADYTAASATGQAAGAGLQVYSTVPELLDRARASRAPDEPPAAAGTMEAVVLAGGRGAVVGSPSHMLYLVTDQGMKFAVPDRKTLSVLGYDKTVTVSSELLALIPDGPALDARAANIPAGESKPVGQPPVSASLDRPAPAVKK